MLSLSAITKTGVQVNFEALTEALENAKVSVMNDKGAAVEVKPMNLVKGETEAMFKFVTELTADPVGKWTVNGVAFDLDAQKAVAAVKNASNQVELLKALQVSYFKNVKPELIAEYDTADFSAAVTVEDVQKIIDEVNMNANVADVLKEIKEAKNQVELLAALKKGEFKRINDSFIADYMNYDENSDSAADYTVVSKAADVQRIIDKVNVKKATDAVTAADTTVGTALTPKAITAAQELVSALSEDTAPDKAVKENLQKRLDKANAVVKVKSSTTPAGLLSALKAPALALNNIDDLLAKYYKKELDSKLNTITAAAYDLQTEIVTAGKTAATSEYIEKIKEIKAETSLEDVKMFLTELKRLDSATFTEKVVDALMEDYRAKFVSTASSNKDSVTKINGLVQTVNTPTAALTVLVDAGSELTDADELLAALKAKVLDLKVADANKDAYFADIAAIKLAAGTGAADVQEVLDQVDFVVATNKATTTEEMKNALTGFAALKPVVIFVSLSSASKMEVAEVVLAARMKDGVFANIAALNNKLDNSTAAYKGFLDTVNAARNISDMKAALDEDVFPAFQALGEVQKVEKAEMVFNELTRLKGLDPAQAFMTIAQVAASAGL